jgi:hypothetical protein
MANGRKWKGPGRYEIRYNQFQIDTMARRRLLRYSMRAWWRVIGIYREAHRRYRVKLSQFVRDHLLAWRAMTARNLHLYRMAITAWREYPVVLVSPRTRVPLHTGKQRSSLES